MNRRQLLKGGAVIAVAAPLGITAVKVASGTPVSVDPPLTIFPGKLTWVDAEYDERIKLPILVDKNEDFATYYYNGELTELVIFK